MIQNLRKTMLFGDVLKPWIFMVLAVWMHLGALIMAGGTPPIVLGEFSNVSSFF